MKARANAIPATHLWGLCLTMKVSAEPRSFVASHKARVLMGLSALLVGQARVLVGLRALLVCQARANHLEQDMLQSGMFCRESGLQSRGRGTLGQGRALFAVYTPVSSLVHTDSH